MWHDRKVGRDTVELGLRVLDEEIVRRGYETKFPVKYFGVSSLDYFEEALNVGRETKGTEQASTLAVLVKCAMEPYQKAEPHVEFVLTGIDLYSGDRNNNFVYGTTIPINTGRIPPGFTIISDYRISEWYSDVKPQAMYTMILHEFSHLFSAPRPGREGTVEILGTHCILDDCAMGQVNVVRPVVNGRTGRYEHRFVDLREQAVKVAKRKRKTGDALCRECRKDLEYGKEGIAEQLR